MKGGRLFISAGIPVMIIMLLISVVSGHVPEFAGDDKDFENAVYISDPVKSWAYYDSFDSAGSVSYYHFYLEKGERLWLSVFSPSVSGIHPNTILAGETIGVKNGDIPENIYLPKDYGYILINGIVPIKPDYEPFTPSANYGWLKYEYIAEEPGDYYIVVFNSGTDSGSYGLAIGYREEFSLSEWLMIPVSLTGIRIWAGTNPLFIFGFPVVILFAGLYLFHRRFNWISLKDPAHVIGISGGMLCIAGALSTFIYAVAALIKTGISASFAVTLIYVIIPALIGTMALRLVIKEDRKPEIKNRYLMIFAGISGLIFWAGYIAGPVLMIVSGLIPTVEKGK